MIVYGIFIWKIVPTADGKRKAVLMNTTMDLSSIGFFQRSTAREILTFGNRQVVCFARPGTTELVKIQNGAYNCHYSSATGQYLNSVCCTVTTDGEYPGRVAFSLARKVIDEFLKKHSADVEKVTDQDVDLPSPEIAGMIAKYQDPVTADPVSRMEADLKETQHILVETLDQLMARGDSLEKLVETSNDLSLQSKYFLKNSQKLNSCCTIL